jgi:hypothetical protein
VGVKETVTEQVSVGAMVLLEHVSDPTEKSPSSAPVTVTAEIVSEERPELVSVTLSESLVFT